MGGLSLLLTHTAQQCMLTIKAQPLMLTRTIQQLVLSHAAQQLLLTHTAQQSMLRLFVPFAIIPTVCKFACCSMGITAIVQCMMIDAHPM